MSDLRITLFGAPDLTNGVNGSPLGKKALALLAFLTVQKGRQFPREQLAGLLWSQRFDEQAQQSLRQALTTIRRRLGVSHRTKLMSSDSGVGITSDAVSTDYHDFLNYARSSSPDLKDQALDLYADGFLSDFGPVTDEFDTWAQDVWRQCQQLALEAAQERAEQCWAAMDFERSQDFAQRALEIDRAHEPAHRLLMQIFSQTDRRSLALRQYDVCAQALADTLDAAPDEDTVSLYEAIRTAADEAIGGNPDNKTDVTPLPPGSPPPGRDQRVAQKRTSWATKLKLKLSRRRVFFLLGAVTSLLAVFVWQRTLEPSLPDVPFDEFISDLANRPPGLACLAPADRTPDEPTLLIVPIRYIGDDPGLSLFSLAASEAVHSLSSLISGVTLVGGPRQGNPDLSLTASELAEKTRTTHILDASARHVDDALRISLHLYNGQSGAQIWHDRLDIPLPLDDAAGAQNDLAMTAAQGIYQHLTDGQQALGYRSYEPEQLAVLEHNTKGYGYLGRVSQVHNDKAKQAFAAALALDDENPGALAGYGFTLASPALFRWADLHRDDLELARRYAERALRIDPSYVPAINLSATLALLEGDLTKAQRLADRAVDLSGGGADATAFKAHILTFTDQHKGSADLAEQALRLRPYTYPTWYAWSYARALRASGDPAGAIACLKEIDYTEQGTVAPAIELIWAYAMISDLDAARPLVTLVEQETDGTFSAQKYCTSPAYQNGSLETACIEALTRAGFAE